MRDRLIIERVSERGIVAGPRAGQNYRLDVPAEAVQIDPSVREYCSGESAALKQAYADVQDSLALVADVKSPRDKDEAVAKEAGWRLYRRFTSRLFLVCRQYFLVREAVRVAFDVRILVPGPEMALLREIRDELQEHDLLERESDLRRALLITLVEGRFVADS